MKRSFLLLIGGCVGVLVGAVLIEIGYLRDGGSWTGGSSSLYFIGLPLGVAGARFATGALISILASKQVYSSVLAIIVALTTVLISYILYIWFSIS